MADDAQIRAEIVELIPRLRRFALGLSGNWADADDLVQSALEKALTRLHQFQPGTRLDSWMFRIVQTTFIDSRRRAARREDGMDAEALDRLPEVQTHADAQNIAASRSALSDIELALATLSEEQRSVVMLVLVEGYSYEETAGLLDVPVGTIMSRLARGRKAIATALEETVS